MWSHKAHSPQYHINDFWYRFATKQPSKVTSIFPRILYASILPEHPDPRGIASARNAADSYEAAANECREKVAKIVRECYRTNEKFTDADFDVETDLDGLQNCLKRLEYESDEEDREKTGGSRSPTSRAPRKLSPGLQRRKGLGGTMRQHGVGVHETYGPESVHRIGWIFQDPKFTVDGFSSSDIQQGSNGDCWWLAAVATIAHRKDLMKKVCVAQNEECGVYGFVFHRDGEWISTVVDDNLYLKYADFNEAKPETYDPTGEKARKYRAQNQTGSEALYFAQCDDANETWLPLLEKAFAKAHGDYNAIAGGWSGEAVEDMTGGVATTIATKKVLSKDKLWKELAFDDGDFVFAMSATAGRPGLFQNSGVAMGHAYSILRATEEVDEDGKKHRFVKIRNPWGRRSTDGMVGEWNGRWSDGSKEWTPYWMKKLNHTFGDDGIFWMLYEDVLETFKYIHRTRLFDEKWTVIQQWTSCDVAWLTGFSRTKFVVDVKKTGTIVLVLAQLDDRYFGGLEGQYDFELHFLLKKEGAPSSDYICRVRAAHEWENRSVSAEVLLDPGKYEVIPKITATRHTVSPDLGKIIKQLAERNPQKLRQVGMQYDLAHIKGGITDEDQLAVERRKWEKKQKRPDSPALKVKVQFDAPESSKSLNQDVVDEKRVTQDGAGEQFQDAAENLDNDDAQMMSRLHHDAIVRDLEIRSKTTPALPGEDGVDGPGRATGSGERDEQDTGDELQRNRNCDGDSHKKYGEGNDEARTDHDALESYVDEASCASSTDSEEEDDGSRWNAVCVACLRVYSQDPDLTISLVQPETIGGEPSSSLVQGQEPAGATQ